LNKDIRSAIFLFSVRFSGDNRIARKGNIALTPRTSAKEVRAIKSNKTLN
jgi:hypothetical protein